MYFEESEGSEGAEVEKRRVNASYCGMSTKKIVFRPVALLPKEA